MEGKARAVVVDANVLVALFNQDDTLHKRAVALWQEFRNDQELLLYTSNFVLAEVLTVLRLKASREAALSFGAIVFGQTKVLQVVYIDRELMKRAYEIFSRVPIKDFSFVDASLVALSEAFQAELATFDKHLRAWGKQ